MDLRAPDTAPRRNLTMQRYSDIEQILTSLRDRYRLTPTQARVAALLADRQTNAEIAMALCIQPSTARRHTEAVLLRLGVSSRFKVIATVAAVIAEARRP